MTLKEEILRFIDELEEKGGATFAQLCKQFPRITGDETMVTHDDPYVILWQNLTKEAVTILCELLKDESIYLQPAANCWGLLIYLVDGGKVPACPMVRRRPKAGYKKPHWLPVMLRIGKCPMTSKADKKPTKKKTNTYQLIGKGV